MKGSNVWLAHGRLGQKPKSLGTAEKPLVSFSLATNSRVPDGDGGFKEHTEWHRCVASGQIATNIQKYLDKGSGIWVRGRHRTRPIKATPDHPAREVSEFVIDEFDFLPSGDGATRNQAEPKAGAEKAAAPRPALRDGPSGPRDSPSERNDVSIPPDEAPPEEDDVPF